MPTYEFACPCGEVFEQYHCTAGCQFADCPSCGASAKKQFSPAMIIMPCTGWPAGTWANNTNEDFAPEPDKQPEFRKTIYPMGAKRSGNRYRF